MPDSTKKFVLADAYSLLLQIIQIPPNGFRDGNMGDDKSPHSAQEGLQIYLLSRMGSHDPSKLSSQLTPPLRNVRSHLRLATSPLSNKE